MENSTLLKFVAFKYNVDSAFSPTTELKIPIFRKIRGTLV